MSLPKTSEPCFLLKSKMAAKIAAKMAANKMAANKMAATTLVLRSHV